MKKEVRDITKTITEAKTFFIAENNVKNMRNLLAMLTEKDLKKF